MPEPTTAPPIPSLPPPVPCHVCGLVDIESFVMHEGHPHCEMCHHRVTNFQLVFTGTVGIVDLGTHENLDILDTPIAYANTLSALFNKFFFGEGAKVLVSAKGGNIRIDMLEPPPSEA